MDPPELDRTGHMVHVEPDESVVLLMMDRLCLKPDNLLNYLYEHYFFVVLALAFALAVDF